MPWLLDSNRPIYLQLVEQIQQRIISGVYHPGDKLPSVRDFATEASVNPNTMQKALTELERSGLVFANRTSGRFISEDTEMLKKMKYSLAEHQLNEFINKMMQLGFNKEETLSFILETASKAKFEKADMN